MAEKNTNRKPVGAVVVVGGGIGGIQASLDLAESGYRVYLVEESSAIGGRMSQLDKTFPTNDCSMCIISPKLVEVGKNRNIEVLTNASVEAVDGGPGDFTVAIKQRPRFIDLDKCTGCGECAEKCPVFLDDEFNMDLSERHAVFKKYPQAIPNAFAISKRDRPPCVLACPAGTNVQGYVALASQGRYEDACDVILERNPFPSICGRVCHHPCESECSRKEVDEPVAINNIKRFIADRVRDLRKENGFNIEKVEVNPEKPKIAVVGSGPSGLTCARDLVLWGYPVTIFEAEDRPGGAMRYGIPEYRLPEACLDWDIQHILDLGIELKTGMKLGRDVTINSLKADGFKAIYLGVGLPLARRLDIRGSDLDGVLWGVDFLRSVKSGDDARTGKEVIVIGGGNVAIDVAMTAKRQGAEKVTVVSLECREEMPAHEWEIQDAIDEGIEFEPSWGPDSITGDEGRVSGISLTRCACVFDDDGGFDPKFDRGCTMELKADTVILAIGQGADLDWIGDESPVETKGPGLKADPLTLETNIEGVFAGGDVVYGPKSVVEAINQGHEAAESIRRFDYGRDPAEGREKEHPPAAKLPEEVPVEKKPRHRAEKSSVDERRNSYVEVEKTFTEETALEEARRCLNCGICSECMQCVKACLAGAVIHDDAEQTRQIRAGSVILAPGFDLFDPSIKARFGYGTIQNVVTSMEFERILSASGPFRGEVVRPSDKNHPAKIAWIQCVGSRDISCGNEYCSSVCCMYATKEAIIAREHGPSIEPTIFYMDIRAFGKGFDLYYERAQQEHGVQYIRSMVSNLIERPDTGNVIVRYVDEAGRYIEDEYDLVVLSTGIVPSLSSLELCSKLDVNIDSNGFCETEFFSPLQTSREGIYVCGAFQSPKDIPETVAQASGAASCAGGGLAAARGELIEEVVYPDEIDVSGQEERIGVFVCNCGINIGGFVDVPAVKEYAATLHGVVFADENLYTCSQDTQQKIRDAVIEHALNRVVVASCSPGTHEPLFQSTIREAGLNKYLFEMANIRDQCSWVHQDNKEKATGKAKDLVRMAVAGAKLLQPLQELAIDVNKGALVIGGGAGGMTSALALARQGFETTLVEKGPQLGGNLRHIHYTIQGDDVQEYMDRLINDVESSGLITVFKNAEIEDSEGYKGNFTTSLLAGPAMRAVKVKHGVTIVATGARESVPDDYMYGSDDRIVTQQALEHTIIHDNESLKKIDEIVMIQCVGSRDEKRPYCSRICCSVAVKNALKIKEINPDARVYVLYRDIRTYGLLEKYYRMAREQGVIFIRYDADRKPEVGHEDGSIAVQVFDPVIGFDVKIKPGLVVLSSAIIPNDNEELATLLKVNRTGDGFYLEAHMKLRPVDFAAEGIFMCGMGHLPKLIEETVAQAEAAAARAITVLSKDEIKAESIIARVNPELCAACLTCVRVCAFDVPFINEDGVAEINPALCQGCGTCVSDCPGRAIELQHFRDQQIIAKCMALTGGGY